MALLRLCTIPKHVPYIGPGARQALVVLMVMATPLAAQAFQPQEMAQTQLLPPRNVPYQPQNLAPPYGGPPDQQNPVQDQGADATSLLLTVQRLEGDVRRLTGQVQELQFHQRQLEKKLAQMPAAGPSVASPALADTKGGPHDRQQGDAFNPADHPTAAGAPQALGTTSPSRPLRQGEPRQVGTAGDHKAPFGRPLGLDTSQTPSSAAASPDANAPNASYASGLSLYHQGRYRDAILALKGFIDKNPKSARTPDALYLLGLSYTHRNLNRQAAEQYLRLSTDFATSAKAPSGLVHLGIALNALGAKEDACAALNQVAQKYPKSTSAIKQANVEARRDGC